MGNKKSYIFIYLFVYLFKKEKERDILINLIKFNWVISFNFNFSDGYELGADSDLDDATKPLTRAELQNRLLEGVKKKEIEASKEGFGQYDLEKAKEKAAHNQSKKSKK